MDFKKNMKTSCCVPGAYNGINLEEANPFDKRSIPNQPNQWCSNELIMKDKDLRCQARVQPLDVLFAQAAKMSMEYAKSTGTYKGK